MHKIIAIAKREFTAMVVTKAFVFTLVMMPILMLGGIVLIPALSKLSGQKDRRIVVADASGKLFEVDSESSRTNATKRSLMRSQQMQRSVATKARIHSAVSRF